MPLAGYMELNLDCSRKADEPRAAPWCSNNLYGEWAVNVPHGAYLLRVQSAKLGQAEPARLFLVTR